MSNNILLTLQEKGLPQINNKGRTFPGTGTDCPGTVDELQFLGLGGVRSPVAELSMRLLGLAGSLSLGLK